MHYLHMLVRILFLFNYESPSLKGTSLVLTCFQLLKKVLWSLSKKRENVKYNLSKWLTIRFKIRYNAFFCWYALFCIISTFQKSVIRPFSRNRTLYHFSLTPNKSELWNILSIKRITHEKSIWNILRKEKTKFLNKNYFSFKTLFFKIRLYVQNTN